MNIENILSKLARESYQVRNGNKSYMPLVTQAKKDILEELLLNFPEDEIDLNGDSNIDDIINATKEECREYIKKALA